MVLKQTQSIPLSADEYAAGLRIYSCDCGGVVKAPDGKVYCVICSDEGVPMTVRDYDKSTEKSEWEV